MQVLPDFGLLATHALPTVDAVVFTHAHFDHSGALPVFHEQYPTTPVYMTPPTQALVTILLKDALRIAKSRFDAEGELPPFSPTAVESLLTRIQPVAFSTPTQIGTTALTATWYPAGHILGASAVGIEGTEHGKTVRVLFSGDVAVGDQLTVPGMSVPTEFRQPDVLVIESTYGDRLHSARTAEEQRLVQFVSSVVEQKGKLLIPAFAIGRAQEVALILIREMRQRRLAPFPVFLDGMVRSVCGVYSSFPSYQSSFCQHLVERHGNPFVGAVDEVQMVKEPKEREKILSGPPCVIIASSGMLSGGASADYAPVIATGEHNAIAITGYQDEESPGRRLLDLAEGRGKMLSIGGRAVTVECTVSKYSLSAHADANELARLIDAINPKEVVLVHGEATARPALADRLYRSAMQYRKVHLPKTGETLSFGHRARTTTSAVSPAAIGIGNQQELTAETLPTLVAHLLQHARQHPYSPAELLDLWYGARQWTEAQYTALVALLDQRPPGLRRHPKRPTLFQAADPAAPAPSPAPAKPKSPSQQDLANRVTQVLGECPDLFHVGFHSGLRQVRLHFSFPDIAARRYAEQFQQIVSDTAWTVQLNTNVHQERLAEAALQMLPVGYSAKKTPALHMDRKIVALTVEPPPSPELVAEWAASLHERTGFMLTCNTAQPAIMVAAPQVAPAPTTEGPLEMNATFAAIDAAFAMFPGIARPYRKSLKPTATGSVIELAFVTLEVGQRHQPLIDELSEKTHHSMTLKPEPNQAGLVAYIEGLIPTRWGLQKTPGIVHAEKVIRLSCTTPPRPGSGEYLLIADRVRNDTGWTIVVEKKYTKHPAPVIVHRKS